MLLFDALLEWVGIVFFILLHLIDEVVGGTVAGNGVCRGYNTNVLNLWSMWMGIAVAVDGDVVEHVDIDDVSFPKPVGNALCGCCHTFQKGILRLCVLPCVRQFAGYAVGVDVAFSCAGCKTDRLVFEHTSKASHYMTLEVSQVDAEVVIAKMFSYNVVLDPFLVLHRNAQVTVFVHDVHGKEAVKAMFVDGLPVLLHILSASSIGCAAFNDSAVHFVHKVADEGGLEVVVAPFVACADFHTYSSVCFHAKCVIDFH